MKKHYFIFNDCWKETDVWRQTRVSRGANESVCCAVGSAHCQETLSRPSTHDVLALTKLSDFGISDKGYRTVLNKNIF
jgi:hypothetical protein